MPPTPRKYAAIARFIPARAIIHGQRGLIRRASAHLIPTLADASLAEHLQVKRGTPLLKLDQIAYDAPGRAVLLSVEWHVADAFELIVNRRASAD